MQRKGMETKNLKRMMDFVDQNIIYYKNIKKNYMIESFILQKRPPDNSFYVKTCHKNPKKTRWWYHDDTV